MYKDVNNQFGNINIGKVHVVKGYKHNLRILVINVIINGERFFFNNFVC